LKSCYLYSLLKMKMDMLTDRYIPLEEIDRKLARTLKACCNADTPEQKLAAIDKQFARLFEEIPAAVEGISRAVNMIRTSRGLCSRRIPRPIRETEVIRTLTVRTRISA
jgi:hypothetical protein